jgi:inhibitor of cysteine peptidase
VGDEIEVKLPETATTGFVWQVESEEGALRQIGDQRVGSTVPRGAPGVRVLAFEALRPGEALLRIVKRRPWEREAADEFTLTLEISGEG